MRSRKPTVGGSGVEKIPLEVESAAKTAERRLASCIMLELVSAACARSAARFKLDDLRFGLQNLCSQRMHALRMHGP